MDHLLLESEGTKILKSIAIEFVVHVLAADGTVRVSAMHTGSQYRVAEAQLPLWETNYRFLCCQGLLFHYFRSE